jgi:hypothetical protein
VSYCYIRSSSCNTIVHIMNERKERPLSVLGSISKPTITELTTPLTFQGLVGANRDPLIIDMALPHVTIVPSEYSSQVGSITLLTTHRIPSDPKTDHSSGPLPVGAWIGIGFGVLLVVLVAVLIFFGHKKVTEALVTFLSRRRRSDPVVVTHSPPRPMLDSVRPRSNSGHLSKISHSGMSSTPRTAVPDIPFAAIDIEADGRLSPRLPIMNKRTPSLPSTPNSVTRRF